eukprot:CAMPEP_0178392340 /NCGR_PEP_ID=MMETSP0689_2-20121128/11629_1 /TAXON_ID=160604 /ORGANISM="Amphidinium massartii, Strain CS-259" /LENGTH=703 /DNA_ID=CAMNT_0020012913 /DNA_START=86 /DNA_END=2197 /DNA_ORIENTATION=-
MTQALGVVSCLLGSTFTLAWGFSPGANNNFPSCAGEGLDVGAGASLLQVRIAEVAKTPLPSSAQQPDARAATETQQGGLVGMVAREMLFGPWASMAEGSPDHHPFPEHQCPSRDGTLSLLQTVSHFQSCSLAHAHRAVDLSWNVLKSLGAARVTRMVMAPAFVGMLIIILATGCNSGPARRGWVLNWHSLLTWFMFTLVVWGLTFVLSVLTAASGVTQRYGSLASWLIPFMFSPVAYLPRLATSFAAFVPWPRQGGGRSKQASWTNDPSFLSEIAVVVPCHMSADGIEDPLRSYLKYFEPKQIIVVDNSNEEQPPDNLRSVVEGISKHINYVYVPKGMKALACHVGVNAMPDYKYALIIDDDGELPDNMVFDEKHFKQDERCAGVAWPRDAIQHNLLTRVANFQLKSDNAQLLHGVGYALTGTTQFLIGTIALYRRDYWLDMMTEHPMLPTGEDCWSGVMSLRRGYTLAFETRSCCKTFSPPVLCGLCSSFERVQGFGATTLFKQRLRWSANRARSYPWSVRHLFCYRASQLVDGLLFLIWQFIYILRLPLNIMVTLGFLLQSPGLMLVYLPILYTLKLIDRLGLNYILWSGSEHQASFLTILYVPVIDIFLQVCSVLGAAKCVLHDVWQIKWQVGLGEKYSHIKPGQREQREKEKQEEQQCPESNHPPGREQGPESFRDCNGCQSGSDSDSPQLLPKTAVGA